MGLRGRLRGTAIQLANALRLDDLMLAGLARAGAFLHAVNFHGTPAAGGETFIRQMEWLRSRFTVLNPMALGSFWDSPGSIHKPAALLTFDDGLGSNFSVAAPILESLGLRGLFFVNPGFAQLRGPAAKGFFLDRLAARRNRPLSTEEWTPMTPDQIAELARRGHAIGNHTFSHADLSAGDTGSLLHEIVYSRDVLSQWTGRAVECFAWTYKWNAISRAAWDMARSHHRFCFAPCSGLTSLAPGRPDLMWRTNVECGYSESEYRFVYSGLAAIPAWPKRRRLERELHLSAAAFGPEREERGWLA
ncbi:MAG TPA: polysaccharide deacetylase family protein [Bryobacteraceae bacterium]|nr:polysaccharide deacetylase family protein [Bryobacteraceae bacterium]